MEEEKTTNWIDLEDLGIELGTVKLKKNEFFRIMEKDFPEGTRLTIANVGKVYESKFQDRNIESRNEAFFIDYTFKHEGLTKEVGISYSLGNPVRPDVYEIGNRTNLYRFLKPLLKTLPETETIKIDMKKIRNLEGLTFIGKAKLINGISKDYYIIEPVKEI